MSNAFATSHAQQTHSPTTHTHTPARANDYAAPPPTCRTLPFLPARPLARMKRHRSNPDDAVNKLAADRALSGGGYRPSGGMVTLEKGATSVGRRITDYNRAESAPLTQSQIVRKRSSSSRSGGLKKKKSTVTPMR